jgi:hypothetical protein
MKPRLKSQERGAAVLVVMVTTVAVSALGLLAVRATSQVNTAVGFSRQMVQTHGVADLATTALASLLASEGMRNSYAQQMLSTDKSYCTALAKVSNATCLLKTRPAVAAELKKVNSKAELLLDPAAGKAGSLGHVALDVDFEIEVTDWHKAPAIAGMEVASQLQKTNVAYYEISVATEGRVRPKSKDKDKVDKASATGAGIQQSRAWMLIGPLQGDLLQLANKK